MSIRARPFPDYENLPTLAAENYNPDQERLKRIEQKLDQLLTLANSKDTTTPSSLQTHHALKTHLE